MLNKLLALYDGAVLFPKKPDRPLESFHVFYNQLENEWIGIPKEYISDQEFILLKTLYEWIEFPIIPSSDLSKRWYEFLFTNGQPPSCDHDIQIRFIHFHFKGNDLDQTEIESALKGFFSDDVIIIWENGNSGILVEEKNQMSLPEKDLFTMSETLESDFYAKSFFYIGKFTPFTKELSSQFLREKEYFTFGQNYLTESRFFTFQRVFPAFLAVQLPNTFREMIHQELSGVFNEDPDMYITIKTFLENNLNASLTAKKLYIHRNTLQYRIDKFIEKTGIQLKDFFGAFTVFLACLFFEHKPK
ncbi:PucR family transcriptional regulator [Bacillus salipaludis]|uniref:PucR family transcriptional regulator n=1 Tax=Bacillus salipaludis TaxID=2547811 RepID=UPI002E2425B0|nr:helix-turn-helix domain-containing protein [Bacillus salipaludis]